jgi:hypothetical protein
MPISRSRHSLPALTLLAALLATPAVVHARPSQPKPEVRPAATAFSSTGSRHFLTHLWGASGGSIDPWGSQAPTSGGSIDPNGRGTSSLRGDSGASIDPNG